MKFEGPLHIATAQGRELGFEGSKLDLPVNDTLLSAVLVSGLRRQSVVHGDQLSKRRDRLFNGGDRLGARDLRASSQLASGFHRSDDRTTERRERLERAGVPVSARCQFAGAGSVARSQSAIR